MPPSFDLRVQGSITTVDGFIREVSAVREQTDKHKLWFRGHSRASFKLVPTIGRQMIYGRRVKRFNADAERELLHRFRRRAFPHDHGVRRAGYALFLARHHGLPTRLLDWTANVLCALYFACMENDDSDANVWAFRQRSYSDVLDAFSVADTEKEVDLFDDICEPRVKVVHPVFNSVRLIAQDGGFTWHSEPWRPLEELAGQPFAEGELDVEHLYQWAVPKASKASILRELSGLGVSHRNAFPDLDGIARSLWETEVLWNGDAVNPA